MVCVECLLDLLHAVYVRDSVCVQTVLPDILHTAGTTLFARQDTTKPQSTRYVSAQDVNSQTSQLQTPINTRTFIDVQTVSDKIAALLDFNSLSHLDGFEAFDVDEDDMISIGGQGGGKTVVSFLQLQMQQPGGSKHLAKTCLSILCSCCTVNTNARLLLNKHS